MLVRGSAASHNLLNSQTRLLMAYTQLHDCSLHCNVWLFNLLDSQGSDLGADCPMTHPLFHPVVALVIMVICDGIPSQSQWALVKLLPLWAVPDAL